VDQLADVRQRVKTPIMLDESLCGLADAERAAANGLCDLFNLRLSKCGGFLPALRLAEFAARHGLGYQLGCQVGETAVLSAAGRHFATSVKDLRYVEGSFDRHLVRHPLGTEDITFGWGGWAPAIVRTGLGIGVQEEWVEWLARRKEVLIG
jgi:muconate cycloisomerase